MSSPSVDAKYDDGIEEAFDEADEEASVHVKRYIESLTLEEIGRGFVIRVSRYFILVRTFQQSETSTLLLEHSMKLRLQKVRL
jgi:hypothetical protein